MSYLEQYRPPGRSNRSGRSQADNDVFEGLPVKQWGHQISRISLAPPVSETQNGVDDKWADPPMPRDYQLLNPWTQHLLRLARSGKVGTKRKQDSDGPDDDRPEDENGEETAKANVRIEEERGYVAKKWKPVPEHMLVQEHKHFEFLAKRRKGLPSLYAPDQQGAPIPMRKTKVQRADATGETVVYEVLIPEGQHVEGEILDTTELGDVKPATAAPGTVIEGVGIANEEGILVAEHLKPQVATRIRNRPPPKKKGGPGRGKKRVTFTNPDGSTYTTIVPNATKIVPQPGQIVKHVAKGEEASADVTAEEAAAANATRPEGGEEGDEGSDDGEDDGDDDDDREEGEVSDEDAPGTGAATPAKPQTPAKSATPAEPEPEPKADVTSAPMEDVKPTVVEPDPALPAPEEKTEEEAPVAKPEEAPAPAPEADTSAPATDAPASVADAPAPDPALEVSEQAPEAPKEPEAPEQPTLPVPSTEAEAPPARDPSSSPELPLSKSNHEPEDAVAPEPESAADDDDLLSGFEKHLEGEEQAES